MLFSLAALMCVATFVMAFTWITEKWPRRYVMPPFLLSMLTTGATLSFLMYELGNRDASYLAVVTVLAMFFGFLGSGYMVANEHKITKGWTRWIPLAPAAAAIALLALFA